MECDEQKPAEQAAPALPSFINQDDILTTDLQILEDMGLLEQRTREFEELMADTRTDFKYLSYNDQQLLEFDKHDYVDSLQTAETGHPNKLESINFVKAIEGYMEEKYTSLEQKRVGAEQRLDRLLEHDF